MRHPEIICKKDNCIDKTCSDRHPKPCKHFKTGSCKFGVSCEFTHEKNVEMEQKETEDFKENNSDIKIDDNYVDYDNIDSDEDSNEETDVKFKFQQCEYTSSIKNNLTKHVKSVYNYSCDKCYFKTSNNMHLKMHVKLCHTKNEVIKVNKPK